MPIFSWDTPILYETRGELKSSVRQFFINSISEAKNLNLQVLDGADSDAHIK
jgi:hypothetical protein